MSSTTDECATCHRSHTAKSIGLRKLTGEEQVCFSCHTSGETAQCPAGLYIEVEHSHKIFSTVFPVRSTFTAVLKILAAVLAFPAAMWNVKTVILPTPPARTASGSVVAAPAAQQEIFDFSGVDPLWNVAGAPASFTFMFTAEREYQVCFKCHSSFRGLHAYLCP